MKIFDDEKGSKPVTITLTAEEVGRLIAAAASDVIVDEATIRKLEDALEKETQMQILNDKAADVKVTVTISAEQLMQMMVASVHAPEVKAETFKILREAIFKRLNLK